MAKIDLDSNAKLKKLDTDNFLEILRNFPEQCKVAWQLGQDLALPPMDFIKNIIVTGLGGSAIGGDFLRVYMSRFGTVPVFVNRDYTLPDFVDESTLVFAVSYSGNTEETLAAYDDAMARNAKIMILTSGGELAERAVADDLPMITVPSGFQPRAATGYLFLPILAVVERIGLLKEEVDIQDLLRKMTSLSEKLSVESPKSGNLAKTIAEKLYDRLPVIYGTSGVSEAVAMRFKGQINENAKAMAYFNVLPELNHNEVVGTEFPKDLVNKISLVFLRSADDHPRVSKRFEITKDMLKTRINEIIEIHAEGDTFLSRMFYLTYLGDVMSIYLALLYGINPTPVDIITTLKNRLKQ